LLECASRRRAAPRSFDVIGTHLYLKAGARDRLAGVECEIFIERGNPADVILAMEKTVEPDLVVMATHGRRGFTRLVMGSVAERVVRESITPVLTVRPLPADKTGRSAS
jgi:nucleotide-binding universal stress UspA family protein